MLFLIFYLGEQRYALAAQEVVEVVPVVQLKKIPQAPSYIAGLCNYRGAPVPIIDLCRVIENRSANRHMSTRVIMVHYQLKDGTDRLLGLVAERATEMVTLESKDFVESGVSGKDITCCRRVAIDPDGMIHRVELNGLLPENVRDVIFR
ncbi:MAG: chemotaxis signal transduction protein [Gammaproteobacteria bacterium]|nr:MAG: chemotaxis signal transduction protein [Gammaproteobacteria bacterium]TND03250.1 MAG: chemotaxis signal transduction protein [Gammaproteobacteria bacterium]